MTYWPFWLCALALSGVALLHWLLIGRMFAVSGRFTALTDAIRNWKRSADSHSELSQTEMLEALRAATIAEFGLTEEQAAQMDAELRAQAQPAPQLPPTSKQSLPVHVLFFVAIALGAALSARMAQGHADRTLFFATFGHSPILLGSILFGGGLLVGFGTRMAGGCTSGHGLCGVSRFQPGSMLATAAFFGAGIVTSLLLGALR